MPEYSWQICHCLQDQQLALRWCCMALRDTPWWHQPWQVLHYHTVVFPRQSAWSVPLLGSILRMKVQKNCHKCAMYMERPWHLFRMKITLFRYNATCISVSWVVYPGKIGIWSDDDDNENAHLQLPPVWLLVSLNKINSFRPKLHVHVRILIYTILNDMVSPKDLYINTILLFQDFLNFCQKKMITHPSKIIASKTFSEVQYDWSIYSINRTYVSNSAVSWISDWRVCLRAGAISIEPALHTADRCADTRESKKLSVPISIKQADVFHDNAEGKLVITILFHFSRAFFTDDGRPIVKI